MAAQIRLKHAAGSMIRLLGVILLSIAVLPAAYAEQQKFVYAYDGNGTLLTPNNAADTCPDPVDDGVAAACHGVRVSGNGDYNIELPSDAITSPDKMVLLAKTYNFISAYSKPGIDRDTYINIKSKRRVEKVKREKNNKGANINALSEAAVKAVESHYKVKLQGKHDKSLAEVADDLDAGVLNAALGNSMQDNAPESGADTTELNLKEANLELLDEADEAALEDLAELVVDNQGDSTALNTIEKNLTQSLLNPETFDETTDRTLSQVNDISNASSDEPVVILDADRYVAYVDQVINLTTDNSLNADQFFGYTWLGVDSDTSQATFSRAEPGSYLVCVTGETADPAKTSSDCVRLEVKPVTYAVITAYPTQLPSGESVSLSGFHSVGAQSYQWSSAAGQFADSSAMATSWTAPALKGSYDISLTINNDAQTQETITIQVYDVLPVAIATTDKDEIYISDADSAATLTSSSISTDGSAVDAIRWDIVQAPGGNQAQLSNTDQAVTRFSATTLGEYVIRHTATKDGVSASMDLTIAVREKGVPVADAGPDRTAFRNQIVKLDGGDSYDPDGLNISHAWSSDGGSLSSRNNAVANFSSATLGSFTATLTVSNGAHSASDDAVITVRNRLPLASDDFHDPLLGDVGAGYLNAYDGDGDDLTYSLLTEPHNGGVTIDPLTGQFVYVPGGDKGCKYHPDHTPFDNRFGGKDVPVIKLCADKFVVAINDTVTLTTSNSIHATKLQGFEWIGVESDGTTAEFLATDAGMHQVCISGFIGNSNNTSTACVDITVVDVAPGEGESPSDVSEGFVDSFQFQVNDGYGNSNIATVLMSVGWENTPPLVDDLSLSTDEDVSVSGTLSATDVDNQLLVFSVAEQGRLGTLSIDDAATGAFTYTPDANAFGTDTIQVIAHDGHDSSAPATVTVMINGTNDVPVAQGGNYTTQEDTVLAGGQLSAVEPDGEALSFEIASNGNIGTAVLTDAVNGIFTYTPGANLKGNDSFTFRVTDGKDNSNLATASISVESVNDAPVAHDLNRIFTPENEAVSGSLDGEDIDLDSLTYQLLGSGTRGTAVITDAATGAFTYTPNSNVNGSDTLTYIVSDGTVNSNIAYVPITIEPNDPPVAADMAISTDNQTALESTLSAADPEGDLMTYEIVSNAGKGTVQLLDIGTGKFRYTPSGAVGDDSFSYRASDAKSASNVATVSVTVIEYNNPPVANDDSFVAFEGVPYINMLTGTDSEGSALQFAIASNGRLGSAGFEDNTTGEFSYTPFNGRSGSDHFSFTVSDGDKTSARATVNAQVLSLGQACKGPEAPGFDTDGDGYADVVELEFGADPDDAAVTPAGLNPDDYNVSFSNDNDGDGFSDSVELWLGSDPNDNASMPTDSLNKAVPSCASAGNDHFAPSLLAFDIVTPVVNISGDSDVATFALTVVDNISGVKDVSVLLRSPAGQEVQAVVNQQNAELMFYQNIDSGAFSYYAEAGIWQVVELELVDAVGNVRLFGTSDLEERGFPTEVEVVNANSDISPADLLDFVVLTPVMDLSDPDPKASFTVSVSDNPAGIQRISITLRSPSGTSFRWGEMVDANHPTSFNGQIDANSFDSYAESGTWTVSELAIIDAANNALRVSTAQLTGLGFDTEVQVGNGLLDSGLPLLGDFQILTPKLYPADGTANAQYSVTASDAKSGIDSIEVMLISPSGSESMQAVFTSPGHPDNIQIDMETALFSQIAEAGVWEVSYVVVTDAANNRALYSTADLTTAGFDTTVHVIYLGSAINTRPVAYGNFIILDEDTTYDGQLRGYDADGHALTYHLVTEPSHGSVSIDAASGSFSYSPAADYFGADIFSFRVDDGYDESNIATVAIAVNAVNDAPTAEDFAIEVTADSVYSGVIQAQDKDGDTLTFSIADNGNLGSASLTNANSGAFTYTPNAFALGDDSFTFMVSDGTVSVGPFTVSVAIKPDIWVVDFDVTTPVVSNKETYVNIGAAVTFNKAAATLYKVRVDLIGPSGQIIPYLRSLSVGSSDPISLSELINTGTTDLEAGTWTFRNLSAQEPNEAAVMVLEDLVGAGFTATVEVVDNVDPVAHDADLTTQKNIPLVANLSADDPDGDSLSYSLVSSPSQGSVDIDSVSGEFTYTPPAHTVGSDSFSFKVDDGFNQSNIATVNITIAEANGNPVAYDGNIIVFRNLAYGGVLQGVDPENDGLTYHLVTNAVHGSVTLDQDSGAYVYTPYADQLGDDSFSFYVSDGGYDSNVAMIDVSILHEDQVCRFGDTVAGVDDDGDGYANVVEVAFNTDFNDAGSTPEGMNATDLGISFIDDDDNDGFPDYVEIWLGSDPASNASKPTGSTLGHLPPCFDSGSDGIKPRLLAFDIATPVVDISNGDGVASFNMTLIDNASGVRRARIDLLSPSGAFATTSVSFDDYPLVRGVKLDSDSFSAFAEQGIWQISGITLYDEAGNKRSLDSDALTEAGFPTEVDLRNLNSDSAGPSLDDFSVLTPTVNALTGDAVLSFQVDASDDIAGLNSISLTLASPGGVIVEAVGTFADTTPTSLSTQIDSATLSSFAEQGTWTITSLLLTDAAGNSSQYADQLAGLGYDTTVSVTNTGGDGVAPTLQGFTILTPEIFPAGGNARMSFMVSALDDVAGIEKIRVDLQGPNGQYLAAWGYFFDTTPLSTSAQLDTAVLSDLTQEGRWTVSGVELYDAAGNSRRIDADTLRNSGYATGVTVSY
mgnify:FL=1|jgi:VCBS repeat-containing protein